MAHVAVAISRKIRWSCLQSLLAKAVEGIPTLNLNKLQRDMCTFSL